MAHLQPILLVREAPVGAHQRRGGEGGRAVPAPVRQVVDVVGRDVRLGLVLKLVLHTRTRHPYWIFKKPEPLPILEKHP